MVCILIKILHICSGVIFIRTQLSLFRVRQRREQLFNFHSRQAKAIAGCAARFRSTNVAEAKNATLKLEIMRKLPGHLVVPKLQLIHEGEIHLVYSLEF